MYFLVSPILLYAKETCVVFLAILPLYLNTPYLVLDGMVIVKIKSLDTSSDLCILLEV